MFRQFSLVQIADAVSVVLHFHFRSSVRGAISHTIAINIKKNFPFKQQLYIVSSGDSVRSLSATFHQTHTFD